VLEAGDELLFVAGGAAEHQARALVHGAIARSDELPRRGRSVET
jgi:hypothetical protein